MTNNTNKLLPLCTSDDLIIINNKVDNVLVKRLLLIRRYVLPLFVVVVWCVIAHSYGPLDDDILPYQDTIKI